MRVTDWFWRHGTRRTGEYGIPATWLDRVMGIEERAGSIACSLGAAKPCLALWGPSQSGKSTLLGQYLDGEARDGSDSPLTWGGVNTRFSGTPETPLETLVFNPYRAGLDASGLPTRFRAAREVGDGLFPVEAGLTTRKQILLALASGYQSEARGAENSPVTDALVDNLLEAFEAPEEGACLDRGAFEFLRDVCDVMGILSGSEWERFSPFRADGGRKVRMRLLNERKLTASPGNARRLAEKLFWNDAPKLNALCGRLLERREGYAAAWGERPVRLSMEAAVVLENISSADRREGGGGGGDESRMEKHRQIVRDLRHEVSGGCVRIGRGLPGGEAFGGGEFAYLQALIGEMRIPLDVGKLEGHPDFREFLERADLLDLPGVTNVPLGSAAVESTKIDLGDPAVDDVQILTKLYKTGKTLSVIYGQAEKMGIDAFSISIGGTALPLRRPRTIQCGVESWIRTMEPAWAPGGGGGHPLRLYVNLTAFGDRFHEMASSADPDDLLDGFLRQIRMLPAARAEMARFFFTSHRYAHRIEDLAVREREAARRRFLEHGPFREAFLGGGTESFDALCGDGYGTDYLFRTVAGEISMRRRRRLLEKMREDDRLALDGLLRQHLPCEDVDAMKRDRAVWVDGILERLERNRGRTEEISLLIKDLYAVEPVIFPDPPRVFSLPRRGTRRSRGTSRMCWGSGGRTGLPISRGGARRSWSRWWSPGGCGRCFRRSRTFRWAVWPGFSGRCTGRAAGGASGSICR